MILGISGSPRPNSVTAAAVKRVLAESGQETKYISLAGKRINGCISCLACDTNNKCGVKDDFLPIAEAMLAADAIVFGAPNYCGTLNGLSHCLWERCFSFRHKSAFSLQKKPAVIISTSYNTDNATSPVLKAVEGYMVSNKLDIIDKFSVSGYSQCYTCKPGRTCVDGNVVKKYGVVDVITPEMLPAKFEEQPASIQRCIDAGKLLRKALEKRH